MHWWISYHYGNRYDIIVISSQFSWRISYSYKRCLYVCACMHVSVCGEHKINIIIQREIQLEIARSLACQGRRHPSEQSSTSF